MSVNSNEFQKQIIESGQNQTLPISPSTSKHTHEEKTENCAFAALPFPKSNSTTTQNRKRNFADLTGQGTGITPRPPKTAKKDPPNDSVCHFARLPEEMVYTLFEMLDSDSLLSMLQVDQRSHYLIKGSHKLYKSFLVGQTIKQIQQWSAISGREINDPRHKSEASREDKGQCANQPIDEEIKNTALEVIAQLQILTDFRAGLATASLLQDINRRTQLTQSLFNQYAQKHPDQALLQAKSIKDENVRDRALQGTAAAIAPKNLEQALLTLKEITNAEARSKAYISLYSFVGAEIAFPAVLGFQNEEMWGIFTDWLISTSPKQLLSLLRSLPEEESKTHLPLVEKANQKCGLHPLNFFVNHNFARIKHRNTLIEKALHLLTHTSVEHFLRKVNETLSFSDRDVAYREAVKLLEDADLALAVALSIQDRSLRAEAFRQMIQIQAARNLPSLHKIVEQSTLDKDEINYYICRGLASTNPNRAITIAKTIEDGGKRDLICYEICLKLAPKNLVQALDAASLMNNTRDIVQKIAEKFLEEVVEKKADRKDALEALFLALNAATGIQDVQSKIQFIGCMVRTIVEKMGRLDANN